MDMEIVLNFDKKELVIKEAAKIGELYERLKEMLGKDLKNWTIVSDIVYNNNSWWYYQPYKTYPWWPIVTYGSTTGYTLTNVDGTANQITSGTYCLSDKATDAVLG